jgi:hypothetical protein
MDFHNIVLVFAYRLGKKIKITSQVSSIEMFYTNPTQTDQPSCIYIVLSTEPRTRDVHRGASAASFQPRWTSMPPIDFGCIDQEK